VSKVCYDHIELEVLQPLDMRAASYRYDAESGAAQGYNDTLAPEIPPPPHAGDLPAGNLRANDPMSNYSTLKPRSGRVVEGSLAIHSEQIAARADPQGRVRMARQRLQLPATDGSPVS